MSEIVARSLTLPQRLRLLADTGSTYGISRSYSDALCEAADALEVAEQEARRGRGLAREYMRAYGFDDEEIESALTRSADLNSAQPPKLNREERDARRAVTLKDLADPDFSKGETK